MNSIASQTRAPGAHEVRTVGLASLAALGVVFGDLGTSPLYTLQTVVQATGGHFTPESALGVLSSIFWTLIITVSIKYCALVMRAGNRGEGGILALMSLVGANGFTRGFKLLTGMGLLGAALIYGDGVITPAISVLSALEGLNVVTSSFKPFIMPMAVVILLGLFAAQRFGTEKIGRAFGPVMLLWFLVIASLGVAAILHHPAVVAAVNPRYAVDFLAHSGSAGFLVLGGVFLCITGSEALYADMGALRQDADPQRLVCRGIARVVVELRRSDGLSIGQGLGERQSVFPDCPDLVDLSVGDSRHPGHHHCEPGHHHGIVFHDASGHAVGMAAWRVDTPDLGPGVWPDLRARGELAPDDGNRRDDHGVR